MLKPEHISFKTEKSFFPDTHTVYAKANKIIASATFSAPPWAKVDASHMAKQHSFRTLWNIFYGELIELSEELAQDHFYIDTRDLVRYDTLQEKITKLRLLLKCPVNQIPHEANTQTTEPVCGTPGAAPASPDRPGDPWDTFSGRES